MQKLIAQTTDYLLVSLKSLIRKLLTFSGGIETNDFNDANKYSVLRAIKFSINS